MQVILREAFIEKKRLEYFMVGLDYYDDFEIVDNILTLDLNIIKTGETDGVFYKLGEYSINDITFRVYFHEDVGIYAYSDDKKNANLLREVLVKDV